MFLKIENYFLFQLDGLKKELRKANERLVSFYAVIVSNEDNVFAVC
jgi:hypothetical protein